jgi:ABC-2 type transport system ATP-binding protein
MTETVIEVRNLQKVFRRGLSAKRVEAVRGITFSVSAGDIFGFLGPNGAGKTTTIKMLTGLIAPTGGNASLFGVPIPNAAVRARVGFLPENPYIYPYLTPREFVVHCARLAGLGFRAARSEAQAKLERVAVAYAADRPVRGLSKGMVQRTALAAALVADPELLVLDEPMSGLDPVGRREVKDIILGERDAGRTVFFSSHILSDVEAMCDHVAILRQGKVVVSGRLNELLRDDQQVSEITLRDVSEGWSAELLGGVFSAATAARTGDDWVLRVEGAETISAVLARALAEGATVAKVLPQHETLESLFVRKAIGPASSSNVSER